MLEPRLFQRINENFNSIRKHNCEQFLVLPKKKQMKLRLLDIQIVDGIHIDRSKNLTADHYEHRQLTKDKQIFVKKVAK